MEQIKLLGNDYNGLEDKKLAFTANKKIDHLIKNIVGEKIKVKGFIKTVTELTNEETGEVTFKDRLILVDTENKSYYSGSKAFIQTMEDYVNAFGVMTEENPVEILVLEKGAEGRKYQDFTLA